MSINKLTATGRLTADPVLSSVGDSNSASFTLASDTRAKDGNGEYITNFYRCTVWRRLAEIAVQYLHKGDKSRSPVICACARMSTSKEISGFLFR